MSTYDTTIGSHHFTLHPRARRKNGSTKPNTEYQAGFEAGFIVGREAGLKEAEAGKAPLARFTAAKNKVPVLLRPSAASDHFLLGLPCRTCGAYYASDQERCPVCKASRTTPETRTV